MQKETDEAIGLFGDENAGSIVLLKNYEAYYDEYDEDGKDSSMQLRSKKELIEGFIDKVNVNTKVEEDWQRFVDEQKENDLDNLIKEECLKPEETKKFINNSFRDGILKTTGTDVDKILPPVSRFSGGAGNRALKKQTVIDKLLKFFDKYFGLVS